MSLIYRGRWNILTSATNLMALYPMVLAYRANDTTTTTLIIGAMTASMISHLFESHKHGMWGFGVSPRVSLWLNRLDIIGALGLMARVGYLAYLCYQNNQDLRVISAGVGLCYGSLLISENDYSARTQKRFLLFHNIWHVGIFACLGYFLRSYY